MLKKFKKRLFKSKTFCHVEKRWYFCSRFRIEKCAEKIT